MDSRIFERARGNLFDFESKLSDENRARNMEYAETDGSHISTRGYEQLTDYIHKHIKDFNKSAF